MYITSPQCDAMLLEFVHIIKASQLLKGILPDQTIVAN